MEGNIRKGIKKYNERGVISRTGPAFHTPSEFALNNLYYVVWSDQYNCSKAYHVTHEALENYSIIRVKSGTMEFVCEGESIYVGQDEAIFLDFRKEHYYRSLSNDLVKWEVIFNGAASDAYYSLMTETWGRKFRVDSRIAAVMDMIQQELAEPIPQDHKLSYMFQLLFCAMLDQQTGGFSPEVTKAVQYIYDHYDQDLQINEIAKHVSLSRSYFTKLFSRETGYAPREFLQNVRINVARDMLMGRSELPLSAVAENCGFANASHFCKVFKKKIGKSPRTFRNGFYGS